MLQKLKAAEIIFLNSFSATNDIVESATKTGLVPIEAQNLLLREEALTYLQEVENTRSIGALITPEYVLDKLVVEVEAAYDKEHTQTNRIKTLELLAKYLGMLKENINVKSNITFENLVANIDKGLIGELTEESQQALFNQDIKLIAN